jgi:heme/copper-type cytochrome/quinol oxidase subunit 3
LFVFYRIRNTDVEEIDMLTQLWFLINCLFVVLLITFMFKGRTYQEAKRTGDATHIRKQKTVWIATGILAAAAFVAMASVFLLNMRVNG